jgi:hypothetical protein
MRPRDKTSYREQGSDFDIVWTYGWFSYVRAFRSQAYDVLIMFFHYRVYIDSSRHDILGYSGSLSLQSSRSMFGVLFVDYRS